ncbi:LOW QUALITY PROTEIN: histone-lysine N-methyltransferase 2A [Labeo rohita]|uniref:LOW QUALITY PROTEIN: histone-lysine N-methyltransferase 2A n=1 Tax=Labeo rohita TaxID=84645 RepID=UPI0021E23A30|nr:LOW QUALITY PROTEIN: histone-lysine N-methyltransferase 2A [Labeo rohita]
MAAAGGGLPASAVVATVNTSATVRCRFPGRPWTSRSLLKTEKRSHVGRVRAEDRKGPRPVDVRATLREDPSLSRLLGLAEKHRRQREAGFCSSGSDEEGDFTGFKVDGQWSSRSGQSSTSGALKRASSQVKSPLAPDLKSSLLEKPGMKGKRFSRTDQKSVRPKMVIKMAAKKVTKKGVEQAQRPSVDKDGQLKQGSSNKRNGRVLKNQREGTRVSSKTENDENVDGAFEEEEVTERSKKHGTGAVDRQKRQGKLVWTLTLVKGKEQARRVRDTQNQKASTEYAKTHRNKKIAGGDQASGVSLKPVAKRGRGRRTEVKEEPLESLGGDAGVSFSDTLSSSQKKPFVRRRKKLLQQEVCHKVPDSQGQASSMPRKRKRLSLESDSTHLLQPVEGQEQMLGEVERPKSGGRAAQPKHSIRPVISARSSRVIKVPKRFMDDERMSALPERGSPKKPALTEISMDVGKPNVEFQTLDSESKLKTAQEPLILNDEKGVSEKVQSQGVKPVLSSSRPSGGSRGRGRRPGQTADHYKIYWKLKKLTACLTKRRMERLASAGSKLTEVGAEEETYDVEESKSDLKLEDLYSPGVVPKVAIHVGDKSDQTQLASLAEGPAKENVETTNLESTEMTAQNTQMMVEQSGNTQRMSISGANKRMFHLLKRARVQLIKIDQQKQLKSAQLLSGSVRIRDGTATVRQRGRKRGKRVVPANPEGAPQEQLIGGPRIKHVCRAAAVALGQPRAMVPDDIPRLSALPLHEREGITASPAEEDVASHSEPESEESVEPKPTFRRRYESTAFGLRLKRCMRCKGCNRLEDCGRCVFCLDKPKFGGPNKKRQSCVLKKCVLIERNKMRRFNKVQMKRRRPSAAAVINSSEEENEEEGGDDGGGQAQFSPTRRQPRRQATPQSYRKLLGYDSSDTETQSVSSEKMKPSGTQKAQSSEVATAVTAPEDATKQKRQGLYRAFWAQRRNEKEPPEPSSSSSSDPPAPPHHPFTPTGSPSLKPGRRLQLRLERLPASVVQAAILGLAVPLTQCDTTDSQKVMCELVKEEQGFTHCSSLTHSRVRGEHTPSSVLTPLVNGCTQRGKLSQGTMNKIRVDFKEDCHIQNVWLMGGLSILTSVPIMPQFVCLLCASKGQHDMIYCQMCCEPFHQFCLPPDDRPKEENKENWCCRRCKFCHVCGRKSKQAKPVLQCKRCMYCYHPSCLGPTYPKPVKMNTSWICMLCIRCKSCGVTPGKSSDTSWNHELDLCPDCTKLHSKGNFCTVCLKCYEEHEFDSSMMQCARCAHWVHPKCEGLTDDLYEILCRLRGKSLVFSCAPCSKRFRSGWQDVVQEVLRNGLEKIMNGLKNSPNICHLLMCAQCEVCPDFEVVKEQSGCCLHPVEQKLESGLYTSLKAFHEDVVAVMVERLRKEKYLLEEQKPTGHAKLYYIKLVEQVFSWFNSQDPKTWNSHIQEFPSGMLPEAVIPPGDEHSYAQWLKENPQSKSQDLQNVSSQSFVDERQCSLCQHHGDAKPNDAGRLLYIGQNEWAHVNCCMWSAEVQDVKGALLHVHSAVARGRFMRCERCGQAGATVGCCLTSCQSNYHFMCARASNCVFQCDKKVYCYKHRDLINNKIEQGNGFEVLRRVYVDFDGISLRRKFLTGLEPESVNVMIGSLHVQKLGVLTELSANSGKLYPVGYQCSRWYWSTVDPRRRCRYTCNVTEMRPSTRCKTSSFLVDQGENHTIVHSPKAHNDEDGTDSESFSPGLPPSTPSKTKQDSGAGGKTPGYPHSRRPAGGMSRPLPSPGNAVSTSHHILTISDLDETRRATRRRSRNASPPPVVHSGPMALRSGGSIHPRSLSFSPPVSPLGATENLMSSTPPRRRGRPSSSSPSSVTSGPSPPQAALRSPSSTLPSSVRHSPRQQQPFRTTQHKTDEVVQELFALSEPEEAASHGIPTASDRSNQELLSAHFDPDTDVAVASVLNAKLEFDEALLNENVALDCDPQGGEEEGACRFTTGRKDLSSPVASEMQMETVEDVADHYLNFSRTVVVCEPAKDSAQAGLSVLPNSGSISQLDGADNDSESDTGEANADDDTQEVESSFCSQDTEPLKHTGPNKGRTLDDRQLVCPGAPDSVDQNFQPEIQTVDQVCEEQGIQEITLQDGGNMIVDSDSNVQKASFPEELKASTPVLYKSSDLVTTQEEVLLESESTESLQEVFLDDTSGNFISAVDGRVLDLTENNAGHEAATGFSPINQDEHVLTRGLSPVEKPAASVPASNTRTIHVVAPSMPAKRRFVTIRPGSQPRTLQMPMTVASSLPLSVPVSVVSSSPTFSVASQGTPLAPTSVLINGFGALPKEATKGRTIAIRIATPKQVTEQPLPHCLPGAPPTPQVLLVNRAGQILVKNPQTNTYQLPSSNSPSYTQISQIAKIIHSSNVLQRPLPKVTVIPVQQVQASLGKTTPARIISYSSNNGAAPPTQVLIRRIPQSYPGSQLQSTSPSIEKAGSVSESGQKEVAQAIIDKAMASHREITSPTGISPAQLHVEKRLSPESKESFPGFRLRTQPNILSHSRPQVKIKRVSSVTDRIGVKKCRTDFLDQLDPCSQDDHSRSNRVRIKAPSVKDVLDFDDPDVGSLDQPKNEEFKVAEKERITPTVEPTAAQGNDKQDRAKSPCSSKHGDSSDWAPYAGWSSDEDSPSPGKQDKCASQYLPHLRFQITSEDGFSVEADSMDVAWKAVMDGVQEARVGCRLEQFPFNRVSGARVLGVLHDAVLFLLEQLQGASLCQKHCFRFHQHEVPEEELPINPSGCARAEVYVRKSTFDMFNFLASQHRQLPESRPCDDEEDDVMLKSSRRATSTELPMAMRFRHLEKTSKEAVGVYRSAIHGRGLFCKRNIEAGEMVIEYAGNVIRAVLTDKREKYYDSKGIGCYMFRIDDFDVVDATMHGNAARFINHSCDPNCYSRVINVEGQKHIVIFALRKIYRGEELTYDYKFPIEDANNKLHCNCGARRCRRFLN